MSDIDATHARHDVAAEVDEILENAINANMLCMPYDVYFELFDDVARLGVKVEKIESENAELRDLVRDLLAHESTDCERCAYGERCRAHETTCYTAGIIIRKRARDLGVDW